MRRESRGPGMGVADSDRTQRRIRALYATGPLGALGDAELLSRFAAGEGLDREDAFAALVRRHGPMVLSTCRRMLVGDRAGADDAFQAVFLVLARKAGSLRRPDDLRPWLYGVAVKAGKEARRRAGRIHAREGGSLVDLPAPGADADLFDLRAAIDEELERLPGRYREPILLCELEGASRRDAAERLGLAEGTLSSRLARGKSLLRDRLARRGLAVAALGAALAPAKAAGLDALADASVRLMLASPSVHGPPGTASAAVTVAEGVLAMLSAAKLKALAAASAAALGLLASTAGLAWGLSGPATKDDPPPAATEGPAQEPSPRPYRVRGVVVDEEGRPVAGADVRLNAYTWAESRATTAADGSYEMDPEQAWVDGRSILARTADGLRLATFAYAAILEPGEAAKPARIVVRPGREVVARVADVAGAPIADAAVEVLSDHNVVANASTGPDGLARLMVPADESVKWVMARKSATGFDYAEFGEKNAYDLLVAGVRPDALPSLIGLTLANPRTVRLKAVDEAGGPVAGVRFYSPNLVKPSAPRSRGVGGWSLLFDETTGADGVATFDWLPDVPGWTFFPSTRGRYNDPQTYVEIGHADPVVVHLKSSIVIRGRVVQADGAPAVDVRMRASGQGRGSDSDSAHTRTGPDGTYTLHVSPNFVYAVWADVDGWDAPPRPHLAARPGHDLDGVDFQLERGTILRGTLTVGADAKPAAGEWVGISQSFGEVAADSLGGGEAAGRPLSRYINAQTDEQGRFAAHLAPGTYTVRGPADAEGRTIVVAGEPELRMGLTMPRPTTGRFAGRVVDADEKPVAGAVLQTRDDFPAAPIRAADAEGRFAFDRRLDRMILRASSPDGALAGIAEFGPDAAEGVVVVHPIATATGLLLDENGGPLKREKLDWGVKFPDDGSAFMYVFNPEVVTDDEGRFTLPALVVGETYRINIKRGNMYPSAGVVQPSRSGPMDVGALQVGSGSDRNAMFLNVAPKVGDVAPAFEATTLDDKPLALGDFAGKYVLLEFWATWCGPCLGEMPHIRAAYDEFGEDGRLAVVSLSLDDAIDAPRKFQEERKLPWTVGWAKGGLASAPNSAFGVRALPATFLIGPDGKVVARGMRREEIREAVARALAGSSR